MGLNSPLHLHFKPMAPPNSFSITQNAGKAVSTAARTMKSGGGVLYVSAAQLLVGLCLLGECGGAIYPPDGWVVCMGTQWGGGGCPGWVGGATRVG